MRAIGFQLLWIWGVKEMSCIGWDVSQEPELTKLEAGTVQKLFRPGFATT
jgi:hypothetical protein